MGHVLEQGGWEVLSFPAIAQADETWEIETFFAGSSGVQAKRCTPNASLGNTNITTDTSRQATLKAIARARCWYEQITTGKATNIAQLAAIEGVSPRFVRTQMKLVQLSPQSIESLMTRPE